MKTILEKKQNNKPQRQEDRSFFRGSSEINQEPVSFFHAVTPANPSFDVQAKLEVGSSDSPAEKEADAIADKVVRMPESSLNAKQEDTFLSKSALAETISRKGGGDAMPVSDKLSGNIQSARGGGVQLDRATRDYMGSRFGADFSQVKVHTGSSAEQMNRKLNAHAFTVGNDVFFNRGKYDPASQDGKRLLAHELTHVVQQGTGSNVPIRRAVRNYSDLKSNLSYGLLDWVITDGEAKEVLVYLQSLDDDNFAWTVQRMVNDGLVQRLLANVSDRDKDRYIGIINRIRRQIDLHSDFTEESKRAIRRIKDIIEMQKIGQYLIVTNILITALDFGPESAYDIGTTDWNLVAQSIQSFPVIARRSIEQIIQLQILRLMSKGNDLADEQEFWNQMGRVWGVL